MIIRYSNVFAELAAVRRVVVGALVDRGFPDCDAQAVARDVVAQIVADVEDFSEILDAAEDHAEALERMAIATYLRHLQAERRRRRDSNAG